MILLDENGFRFSISKEPSSQSFPEGMGSFLPESYRMTRLVGSGSGGTRLEGSKEFCSLLPSPTIVRIQPRCNKTLKSILVVVENPRGIITPQILLISNGREIAMPFQHKLILK